MRKRYPFPIATPPVDGLRRPFGEAIRGATRLCSTIERIGGSDARLRSGLHGLPWVTPILGSGCLDLDDGPAVDFEKLEQRLSEVLADAGVQPAVGEDTLIGIAQEFARTLYEHRAHGRTPENGQVAPSCKSARLIALTAILTRIYHQASMAQPAPVSRSSTADDIELSDLRDRSPALNEWVHTAARLALEFQKKEEEGHLDHEGEDRDHALAQLLGRIRLSLSDAQLSSISLSSIRMLTELSWIELIRQTAIYPGWSDFLLELLVDLAAKGGPLQGYRPKIEALETIGASVARLLSEPTAQSWRTRSRGVEAARRNEFYSAMAELLSAQADLHAALHPEKPEDEVAGSDDSTADLDEDDAWRVSMDARKYSSTITQQIIVADTNRKRGRERGFNGQVPGGFAIPHPSAFVTSFDLELEMALWAMQRPFRIVMPLLVTSDRADAEMVWVTALVDPKHDLSAATYELPVGTEAVPVGEGTNEAAGPALRTELRALRAAVRSWRVANRILGSENGKEAGGWCPVVVRVTGSPLMATPAPAADDDLRGDLKNLGYDDQEQIVLTHALTIDEYSSLRQGEHEMFMAAAGGSAGLPDVLSRGTNEVDRVWVAFGVQFDDPVIRTRMFSQLSAASIVGRNDIHEMPANMTGDTSDRGEVADGLTRGPSSPVEPTRSERGFAVNRRLDDDVESTALRWLGLEVAVKASVGVLVPDLRHCARHYAHINAELHALQQASQANGDDEEPTAGLRDADWRRSANDRCSWWETTGEGTS